MVQEESGRFVLDVGILVRRSVIMKIKNTAFINGLAYDIQEDRGFASSILRVTLQGQCAGNITMKLYKELEKGA